MELNLNREVAFRKVIVAFLADGEKDIAQTAELIGVDTKTISKWISGDIIPHHMLQQCIMAIFEGSKNSANNKAT